jgi:ankyrin repeat protein
VQREILRAFLEKQLPLPASTGDENFLNSIFDGGITLRHSSVKQLLYDITDLILVHGADANIPEDGKTVVLRATETNDTLLIRVLFRHKANFSVLKNNGETALMVAMALGNKAVIRLQLKTDSTDTTSANDETI